MHSILTSKPKAREGYYHFQVFKEDIVYRFRSKPTNDIKEQPNEEPINTRGDIKAFSKKSKFRLLHHLRNSQHTFRQFLTLTYPKDFPTDGHVVKGHLNTFLTRLRQKFPDIHYLWVFEAQTRGAPHFHIIINMELPTQMLRDRHEQYLHSEAWAKRWSRITGNADNPKHIRHGLRIDPIYNDNSKALACYMAKYYAKNEQKDFGNGFTGIGRYWGASRGFTIPLSEGIYRATDLKWMLKLCFHYANLERVRAGLKAYRFSTEQGCSIWNGRAWFDNIIAPQFEVRLAGRHKGLMNPKHQTLMDSLNVIFDPH